MVRIIVHIDLNAFFARCEEIKDPSIENKPLIVGGNQRRGIVSTANYVARKYGIHSAMPTYQAKKLCPHLIIKNPDFRFYQQKSHDFLDFVKRHSAILEVASIDECYVDMTDVLKDCHNVRGYFEKFQHDLFQETQLYCSIGIAPTKFLAKMGSDMRKPNGITIIRRRDLKTVLHPIPIENMYGIGKKNAPRLRALGIKTIGDLANDDSYEVKKVLGKFYYVLKEWANGRGDDHVDVEPWDPKSIGHSSTLLNDTDDYEEIKNLFMELAKEVANEAQAQHKKGQTVQIVIKYSDFKVNNRSKTFPLPFNDFETIYRTALNLFDQNYQGRMVRLLGVTLQNLVNEEDIVIQMTLFDYQKHEEESATKLLIQEMNRKAQKPIFKRASEVKKK